MQSHSFMAKKVRIASVQWHAGQLVSKDQFYEQIDYYVRAAADYAADFIVFPELFTLCLMSLEEPMEAQDVVARSAAHTHEFTHRLTAMAKSNAINIVGGSHLTTDTSGKNRNISYLFCRDGSVQAREKIHPTPTEKQAWQVEGGNSADIIETDCGPVGIMICYDSEFPELARHLSDQGANIVFVPYCTDTAHGHLRVRYCCHARTVENQCFVVTSGIIGNFKNVPEQFGNFARSAILTPNDLPFARDGIAAEASEDTGCIIFADLDLEALTWARQNGSVRNLADRRTDLYAVSWEHG